MTARARFSQSDLTRAVKAAEQAGVSVARIRIEADGAIEIVAGAPEMSDKTDWFAGSPLYRNRAA